MAYENKAQYRAIVDVARDYPLAANRNASTDPSHLVGLAVQLKWNSGSGYGVDLTDAGNDVDTYGVVILQPNKGTAGNGANQWRDKQVAGMPVSVCTVGRIPYAIAGEAPCFWRCCHRRRRWKMVQR